MTVSIGGATIAGGITVGDAVTLVTNGLVVQLDAGNASSYPGTGTTWFDLSGNGNNATLVGGASYTVTNGGGIQINASGVNQGQGVNVPVSSITNQWTLFGFLTRTANPVPYGRIFGSGTAIDSGEVAVTNTTPGDIGINPPQTTAGWITSTGITISANETMCVCFAFNKNDIANNTQGWKNGVLTYQGSLGAGSESSPTIITLGNRYDYNGEIQPGNYYIFLAYNRILTTAEVAQNFYFYKNRFGL
jgi:hypothetical protein